MVSECNSTMMREILLDQDMTIESAHLLNREYTDRTEGLTCNRKNLTLCHIDTSAILPDLMTDEEIAWLNAYNADVYRKLSPALSPEVAEWLRERTAPVVR